MNTFLERSLDAFAQFEALPNFSAEQSAATLADAYACQSQIVAALRGTPSFGDIFGYKAALTAPVAQQAMGTDQPVIGVLPTAGDFSAAAQSGPLQLQRPVMLETELGFTLAEDIAAGTGAKPAQPLSAADVPQLIASCQPMIELAAPHLANRPNGIDLVATNSATYGFLCGTALQASATTQNDWARGKWSPDEVDISFYRGAESLHAASANMVMESQWAALAWLINTVLAQGYKLNKGHLLMTGSIGALHPAKPGHYRAEFSGLGCIEFEVAGV
ncbi:MAG TPA: hypothetical protein DER02_05555 [Gammaproteobacteria bacterium]|nr:hypothetical protein [Gammaproteobacteria bacterium]|tara:strand:+ start:10323 stop:11147 length:825 start_codon:yes stop_codon:yes gene_type:complete